MNLNGMTRKWMSKTAKTIFWRSCFLRVNAKSAIDMHGSLEDSVTFWSETFAYPLEEEAVEAWLRKKGETDFEYTENACQTIGELLWEHLKRSKFMYEFDQEVWLETQLIVCEALERWGLYWDLQNSEIECEFQEEKSVIS